MRTRRIAALLLAALLLLPLCACGQDDGRPYTVLERAGEKRYGAVYRKGDRVAEPVEAALSVLAANGELAALSRTWLGLDRTVLPGDSAALEALEDVPESRTLIVGVESEFKPLSSADESGAYRGMSVDLAYAIGRTLGWEIRIQPISSDELGTQLDSGNIDCALGFGLNALNGGKYTLGACYMTSSVLVIAPKNAGIRTLRGLSGEKVGAVKDAAVLSVLEGDEKLMKYAESVTAYLSPRRCLSALEKGWCAAIAMDEIMLESYYS